ncbi:MAG: hypothetical protein ACRDN0_05870 [Trebonia sp.]
MNYLRGFIPWIAFAAISPAGWQWGALVALLIAVMLLGRQRRGGVAVDALVLETSTIIYFAALTALAFAVPHSPLHAYTGALSFGWLALTAWGSIAVRHPFTLGIARLSTPREYWDTLQFLRVNAIITTAWAVAFTVTAAAIAICDASGAGTVAAIACEVAGFVIPAVFTARYPKAVQSRLAS